MQVGWKALSVETSGAPMKPPRACACGLGVKKTGTDVYTERAPDQKTGRDGFGIQQGG